MTDRDQELVDRYYAAFHKELARANTLEKQLAEAEKKLREQVKLLSEEYRFRQQMEKDAHEKQLAEVTRERDEARHLADGRRGLLDLAKAQMAEQKDGEEVMLLAAHDNYQEIKADLQVTRDQLAAQAEHCKTLAEALREVRPLIKQVVATAAQLGFKGEAAAKTALLARIDAALSSAPAAPVGRR